MASDWSWNVIDPILICTHCERPIAQRFQPPTQAEECYLQAAIGRCVDRQLGKISTPALSDLEEIADAALIDCEQEQLRLALTDERLKRARNIASRCRQRVWHSPPDSDHVYSHDPDHALTNDYTVASLDGRYQSTRHVAHIATFSPPVVIRMIDEITRLREVEKRATEVAAALNAMLAENYNPQDPIGAERRGIEALKEWMKIKVLVQ